MLMPEFPPTIAAIEDVLRVLLPVVFMGLYMLGQLLTMKKKEFQNQQRPGPPQEHLDLPNQEDGRIRGEAAPEINQGQFGRKGQQDEPVSLEKALRNEVDEFLRRTRENFNQEDSPRKKSTTQRPNSRDKSRQEPGPRTAGSDRRTAKRTHHPQARHLESGPAEADTPEVISQDPGVVLEVSETTQTTPEAVPFTPVLPSSKGLTSLGNRPGASGSPGGMGALRNTDLRTQSVAGHVAQHIGGSAHIDRQTQAIGQHADNLGDFLEGTSERTQQRLNRKFDHRIGKLQHQEGVTEEEAPQLVDEVVTLLRHPEGMRQLIIANEILKRPELGK